MEDKFWIRSWKTERGREKERDLTGGAGREEIQFVPSLRKTLEPQWDISTENRAGN